MRQFFRGSAIVAFFYIVIAAFSSMAMALSAQIDEKNIEYAIYYGEISGDSSAATDAAFDSQMSIIVFSAISILLLINIFNVTGHWIRAKKSEIRARIISGGSPTEICVGLLLNYTALILIAVVIGMALTAFFLTFDLLVVKERHFMNSFLEICLLSLLFSAVGVAAGASAIWKTHDKLLRRG